MKIGRILAAMLAAALLLAACGIAAAEQEARRMETAADADEWIAVFLGEHPEDLEGAWMMSDKMEKAVAQMGGISAFAKQLSSFGAVREIGSAREEELKDYKAFFVPCVFETMSLDIVLVTDDGVIAGLQTGTYSGSSGEEPESDCFDRIDLALPVPSLNGELPGVLTVPKGDGPFPVVILIHGSGPSDKDEAIMSLKPFKDLAEGLAEQGIAVYRFDKRTYVYGKELMNDRQITLMDESVEDAVNAVQLVAAQERIDPSRIYVLGHSLGGNAVPAIARELESAPVKACGFIMMAASPRPLDVLMREQYEFLYSLTPELQEEMDAAFAELDKLQDLDSLADDDTIMGIYAPYWKWLASYDILQAAEEITQPVLLLQGEEDYQVTMVDFGLWKDAFGSRDNWQFISYPGLTHPFTPGQKTEGSDAYTRKEHVDAQVIKDIASFIRGTGSDH